MQYSMPSVRSGVQGKRRGRWNGRLGVSVVRMVVGALEENVQFLCAPKVCRRLGRVAFIVVPVVLLCNLFCSSLMNGAAQKIRQMEEAQVALETANISLLAKRAVTWGPDNMRRLAEEKLGLSPAGKGQVIYLGASRYLSRY